MNINILVERDEEERKFFQETEERFNKAAQLKVFINEMSFKSYEGKSDTARFYFMKVSLIPPFWLFIPALFFISAIIWGIHAWYIIPIAFSLLCAFIWSPYLFKVMIKKGLRRAGYKGTLKFISDKAFLEEVFL